MKIIIMKKGTVDCTSDSRTYPIQELRDSIENAIKILDQEVLELDCARFNVNNLCNLDQIDNQIEITDKAVCRKLLNYFKQNPDQLSESEEATDLVHMHIKVWKFFNEGNNCSDYINIYSDRLDVSCQDEYDPELRDEFHENIEELLGKDYVTVDSDSNNLISLHINVTEKCSADCKICYINKGLQRELEKEDWDKLPFAEQYAIGGGEPSEYPFITELINYLKNDRKGYVAITTNGQKIIDFGHNPDKIAVSIDGLTQKQHELTHNTNLKKAKEMAEFYKKLGIDVCINHIVHKENIDDAGKFAKIWNDKGYEVNFILFTGDNNLKPTYEQLDNFKKYFEKTLKNEKIMIDSCMGGLLNIIGKGIMKTTCVQGLFSKYYRFGTMTPCSHSTTPYPRCNVIEEYMVHFFKTLRPMIFIYEKDGQSGAHEWAFKAGYQGKIRHKVDDPLKNDTIHILTNQEEAMIKEAHYMTYFKDKMPYWLNIVAERHLYKRY